MIKVISIGPSEGHLYNEKVGNSPSFIKVFHPGCGHCRAMESDWNDLINNIKNNYKGDVGLVNIHADALGNIKSKALENIQGFPTLRIVDQNRIIKEYNDERTSTNMLNFCLKNLDLQKILDVYEGGKKRKSRTRTNKRKSRTKTNKHKTRTKTNKRKSRTKTNKRKT